MVTGVLQDAVRARLTIYCDSPAEQVKPPRCRTTPGRLLFACRNDLVGPGCRVANGGLAA